MGRADYYAEGDWNAVCYICGRKRKASMLVKTWQGFYACPPHALPRQPQDFARGVEENPAPPWVQPMPADIYAAMCTANGSSAVPGQAMPGCAIPGYLSPAYVDPNDPFASGAF